MRRAILCAVLALAACGRSSYIVLEVDSNQLHTGLNGLKAVVSLEGERADLDVVKGSSFELAPGRPLSFAIKFGPDKSPSLAVRRDDWKLLINADGSRPELYNLAADKAEKKNLAAEKPEIVAELKQLAMGWRATWPKKK